MLRFSVKIFLLCVDVCCTINLLGYAEYDYGSLFQFVETNGNLLARLNDLQQLEEAHNRQCTDLREHLARFNAYPPTADGQEADRRKFEKLGIDLCMSDLFRRMRHQGEIKAEVVRELGARIGGRFRPAKRKFEEI